MSIVNAIKNKFPDFLESPLYRREDEDLPYVFTGDLGDFFMAEKDDDFKKLDDLIARFNSLYNSSSDEEKNQLWIGVFEVVGADTEIISKFHQILDGEAKQDFEKFLGR